MDPDSMARRNGNSEAHKRKQTSPDKNEERIGNNSMQRHFILTKKRLCVGNKFKRHLAFLSNV